MSILFHDEYLRGPADDAMGGVLGGAPAAPAAPRSTADGTPAAPAPAASLSARMEAVWGIGGSTPAPETPAPDAPAPHGPGSAFARLARVVAAEIGADTAQLDAHQDLFALGATSRQLLRIAARIAADGGRELALETLFTAADLGALADEAYPATATAVAV
ncbi:acyl carrier protein [Streptomyces sp. NPDC006283]|uniref:acyl carrier protein n=1 Tax=Streptomyces sp. NPDC006283 TaxID=3156741 RepID=UPI0033BD3754